MTTKQKEKKLKELIKSAVEKYGSLRKIATVCDTDYLTLLWLCDYLTDNEYSFLLDKKYKNLSYNY